MHVAKNNFQSELSNEEKAKLVKMIMRLFDHWQLNTASQLILLGLSPTSRAVLLRYRSEPSSLHISQDTLDRIGWLLVIHQSLRSLYPKNSELCYRWISLQNNVLQNHTPLDYMKKNGLIGVAKVARYLQSQLVK